MERLLVKDSGFLLIMPLSHGSAFWNRQILHTVSSQKGLRAIPVCSLETDTRSVPTHRWITNQQQQGRIVDIVTKLGYVYFAPPEHATQPYGTRVKSQIDNLPVIPVFRTLR